MSNATQYATAAEVTAMKDDMNTLFVFICAILVFFMHTGFAMLEAGGVQVIHETVSASSSRALSRTVLSWARHRATLDEDLRPRTSLIERFALARAHVRARSQLAHGLADVTVPITVPRIPPTHVRSGAKVSLTPRSPQTQPHAQRGSLSHGCFLAG